MQRWMCLLVWLSLAFSAQGAETLRLIEVRKIWDKAPHNAFTDLIRFQDRWFCTFREGKAHVSPDGALRVLISTDSTKWESAALITSPNSDLRDPKLTITPDGQLMLTTAEALHDKSKHTHQSLAWFSKDGRTWSEPYKIGDPDFWLWRTTWHKGKAYSIGYGCNKQRSIRLYTSSDGKKFDTLVKTLSDVGYPNETGLIFVGDTAYCLLRRDDNVIKEGQLGISKPPYTTWEWKGIGARIGGPQLIRVPDGRLLAAVRLYDKKMRTSLCWIDAQTGKLTEALALPSAGDSSYPGMVLHEGTLYVSYYSEHEGKSSIYLARVEIKPAAVPMGNRRELMLDTHLVERSNNVQWKMHPPQPRELVLTCDKPWEGNTSAYFTLFADGDRFRMYYRGSHWDEKARKPTHPEFTCYAESKDGIHWEKPHLGLHEFQGSRDNNILRVGEDTHNFTPFKDTNPDCPPQARYKALAGSAIRWGGKGLRAYQSPDGIRWTLLREQAVITDGDFDSQNTAFWHPVEKRYVAYYRKFRNGLREIMVSTSTDFLNWTTPQFLTFDDSRKEHLYTNAIQPYFRAPHLLIGFPTRFQPKNEQVEPILMTSRDGQTFRRWAEPLIPITAPKDRAGNRSNYLTHGLLALPGKPDELSVYATEAYYAGPGSRLRRFTFRTDGFVSIHASDKPGEFVTKPLTFDGKALVVNYATANKGQLRVEIQDSDGKPLPGFALDDCQPLSGDAIEQPVKWQRGNDLSGYMGQPIRLRFVLDNTDLYALQFVR